MESAAHLPVSGPFCCISVISRPPERDNVQRRVVKAAQCPVRLVTFVVIHRAGLLKIHRENRAKVEGDFPPGVSRQA